MHNKDKKPKAKLKLLKFPVEKTRVSRLVKDVLKRVKDSQKDIVEITFIAKLSDGTETYDTTLPMVKDVLWQIEQFKHTLLFEKT